LFEEADWYAGGWISSGFGGLREMICLMKMGKRAGENGLIRCSDVDR